LLLIYKVSYPTAITFFQMDCFKGVVKLDIDCETPSGFPGIATVCGEIRVKPHSSSWKHARPLEDEGGSTQDLD